MATKKTPSLMTILSLNTYPKMSAWFEQNDDKRTPAKAVMALANALEQIDAGTGETHTVDQRMEAARMTVLVMAGFLMEHNAGNLPAAVRFIAENPIDVICKYIELNSSIS